jgi:hypothetical protein
MKFWRAQKIQDGDHGLSKMATVAYPRWRLWFPKPWRPRRSQRPKTSFELNKETNSQNDDVLWYKGHTKEANTYFATWRILLTWGQANLSAVRPNVS